MSRKCDVCGKVAQVGNNRSHALNKTKRRFKPNLHSMRAMINSQVKKIKVCSSCLRAGKVEKVV